MLIAARNSQDFACCARATASARSKYASAFAPSGPGDFSAISPAMRWMPASHHVSLVVSTAVIASPMQRQASSNWPSSAYALAKYDKFNDTYTVDPVDRHAAIPEVIMSIASEALPVRAKCQPRNGISATFQYKAPFSSAKATTSSSCAVAAA